MDVSTESKENVGKLAIVAAKLTWRINEISKYCQLSRIESPAFKTTTANVPAMWKLILSVDDECQNSENVGKYFDIYVESLNPEVVRATVNFYILGTSDEELEFRTLKNHEFKEDSWGFENYIERQGLSKNILSKYKCDDCLTIVCKITTADKFIKVEAQKDKIRDEEHIKLLEFKNFAKLFRKPKFSDVVLDVKGQEIHAHKCILANRSLVFEAMFRHKMSETENNRVKISDISYNAMKDMILYIYTGNVPKYGISDNDPGKSYMDVLTAANKYNIANLKEECEKKLLNFLKVDNVFEYLIFSDTHNAYYLKEKAKEFIVNYGKEIVELPSFKKHCSELDADLVGEVFEAFVIKKRKIE